MTRRQRFVTAPVAALSPRRSLAPVCAVLALFGAACGGPAADVYRVIRSGSIPGADLTLIPSEDGTLRCNGRRYMLPDPLLLTAENLVDQLRAPATNGWRLRAGSHPIYAYVVTTPSGTFSYSDDSPHQGSALYALQAWVRTVVRTVCQ